MKPWLPNICHFMCWLMGIQIDKIRFQRKLYKVLNMLHILVCNVALERGVYGYCI